MSSSPRRISTRSRSSSSKAIVIEKFVDAAAVDPIYFETPYYLAPDGAVAEETFRVIQHAMRKEQKVGLSRIVLANRERLIALTCRDRGFLMMTLRTADEVRDSADYFTDIKDDEPEQEMLDLAEKLIEQKSGTFDPSEFKDRYHDAVVEMVKAKVKGQEPVLAKAPERGKVINLMDALKRSLEEAKPPAESKPRQAAAGKAARRLRARPQSGAGRGRQEAPQGELGAAPRRAETMIDLADQTVTIVGRLAALSNRSAAAAIERHGGTVRRGLSPPTTLVAVGRHAAAQLANGRLQARLARADEIGARCISEAMLLRALDLLPPAAPAGAALRRDELPGKVGLDPDVVRLLALFDIIQRRERRPGLSRSGRRTRDRAPAQRRPASRRDHPGRGPGRRPEVRGRRPSARPAQAGLRRPRQPRAPDRRPLRRARRPDAPAAAQPRQSRGGRSVRGGGGRRAGGRSRERRSALPALRRARQADPIAPFNLANVLREQGRLSEAKSYLQLAIAVDPTFADAWYNLALLLDGEGQKALARDYLERASAADPDYADPLFKLAKLCFDAGELEEAGRLWRRYLILDPDSEWSRRARLGLAFCRRGAEQAG